ncbi:uncharacterized protein LOC127011003 [Drosophila biarmipes]|uniref:uncharacterized protein LOC127011003 n=1 Tax=Drosophila biarmipes TaxID=125945 RepID=UPI0021CCD509|nr:uncharacterized protein LOC127011003 [Drosophila biarmipes]
MPPKLFCLILSILFLNRVTSISATSLAPSIDGNGVLLVPSDNKYDLRVMTDGATREETVEQISPDSLQVKGTFRQTFPGPKYLLVIYDAGTNGYVAKYILSVTQSQIHRLSPAALKTASG